MKVPGERWARWRAPIGYPVAALCLWLARPTMHAVLVGAVIAIAGLLVRASAAGYLRKREALARTGPYARTRNPLYFGSALMALGFMIASNSLIVAALLSTYFLIFYRMVIRREESELRAQYGREFDEYAESVPMFLPRLRVANGHGGTQFSFSQYLRNREYEAAIGVVVLVGVLLAMAIWRK